MSIESVMPSSHLILCCPLLLLLPIPPSIRVFSNESTLCMRWPKYWSFSFSIIPSKEIPGLISFRMDLTSHSRMSGYRWVITPSWLCGSWRSFLYSSSVYSCHLFLISSASVRSIPFLSYIVPFFAWNVPLVSLIFLKRSLVFPILLFSFFLSALITEEGFLISPCYSLGLCIQIDTSFLFSFVFSFSSFLSCL